MRWFKHYSDASEHEKHCALIAKWGMRGYGIYWIILEKIAQAYDGTGEPAVEYPLTKWLAIVKMKSKCFQNILETFSEYSHFVFSFNKDKLKIACPNLLKLRDNYTKNLQVSDKNVSIDIDIEKRIDNNIITPPGSPPKGEPPIKKTKKPKTEPPDPRVSEFIQKACFEFKKKFNRDYPSGSIPRITRSVKNHIGMGVDKLLEAWLKYLNGDFWFDRKTGKSLTIFFNHLPEIITAKTQNRVLSNDESLMNLLKGGEK